MDKENLRKRLIEAFKRVENLYFKSAPTIPLKFERGKFDRTCLNELELAIDGWIEHVVSIYNDISRIAFVISNGLDSYYDLMDNLFYLLLFRDKGDFSYRLRMFIKEFNLPELDIHKAYRKLESHYQSFYSLFPYDKIENSYEEKIENYNLVEISCGDESIYRSEHLKILAAYDILSQRVIKEIIDSLFYAKQETPFDADYDIFIERFAFTAEEVNIRNFNSIFNEYTFHEWPIHVGLCDWYYERGYDGHAAAIAWWELHNVSDEDSSFINGEYDAIIINFIGNNHYKLREERIKTFVKNEEICSKLNQKTIECLTESISFYLLDDVKYHYYSIFNIYRAIENEVTRKLRDIIDEIYPSPIGGYKSLICRLLYIFRDDKKWQKFRSRISDGSKMSRENIISYLDRLKSLRNRFVHSSYGKREDEHEEMARLLKELIDYEKLFRILEFIQPVKKL